MLAMCTCATYHCKLWCLASLSECVCVMPGVRPKGVAVSNQDGFKTLASNPGFLFCLAALIFLQSCEIKSGTESLVRGCQNTMRAHFELENKSYCTKYQTVRKSTSLQLSVGIMIAKVLNCIPLVQ